MNRKVRAITHGAISIVNAVATGKGSALGISLKVTAEIQLEQEGHGIRFQTRRMDNELVNNIVYNTIPKDIMENNLVSISIESEIPWGYGLKSSSSVSNALALACCKLVNPNVDDYSVLDIAVQASLDSHVTITGAYDDATACYFGGFVLTDNYARTLIRREEAPDDLHAIILIPKEASSRRKRRNNIHKLTIMSDLFLDAFKLAEHGKYWKAMKLNGVLASTALSMKYETTIAALENGALGATLSGNGPSITAVAYKDQIENIKSTFAKFNGVILVSKINNQKASVEEIIG
jgi:shikimate kinase